MADIDLSFLPDAFKGDDGAYDTAKFSEHYDGLASFKAQADEATAALPKDAKDYAFAVADDFAFPEGFDPKLFQQPLLDDKGKAVLDEAGKEKTRDFETSDMIDPNDPDLPLLQAALHKVGAKPELMNDLAGILANRELRGLMKASDTHDSEKKLLGPEGQSRIDTVTRTLASKLPAEQAKAIGNAITSADALRGIEAILKSSKQPVIPAPGSRIDNATASIDDRIMAGLDEREA